MSSNVDGGVATLGMPTGDQHLIQLKVLVHIMQGHAKVGISTPGSPVICSEADPLAVWKNFGQLFIHGFLAVQVQKRYFVPVNKGNNRKLRDLMEIMVKNKLHTVLNGNIEIFYSDAHDEKKRLILRKLN